MSGFDELVDDLDDTIEEELLDPGEYLPAGVDGTVDPVLMAIDLPREIDRLNAAAFTRVRPVLRVRRSRIPALKKGGLFRFKGELWALAEAPVAADDGRWWVAEVQPG
jgi:hypothetical protein